MRKVVLLLVALALCPAAGNSAQGGAPARSTGTTLFCPRRPIGFFQLAAELNRVQPPCASRLECFHAVWGDLETRELAGYAQSNWLWSGPAPKTFTIAEQDAFIAAARARAQTQQPAGKTIREIAFFTDFIVPNHGGAYFVGARATYGRCVGTHYPNSAR